MKAFLFIIFFNISSWALDSIPKDAQILKVAKGFCGDELTYFSKSVISDFPKVERIQWIIDYAETEPAIEKYDFANDTGKFIEFDKLQSFLNKNIKAISKEFTKKLKRHSEIKKRLQIERNLKRPNSITIKSIRETVEQYQKSLEDIRKLLLVEFKIETAVTGQDCD